MSFKEFCEGGFPGNFCLLFHSNRKKTTKYTFTKNHAPHKKKTFQFLSLGLVYQWCWLLVLINNIWKLSCHRADYVEKVKQNSTSLTQNLLTRVERNLERWESINKTFTNFSEKFQAPWKEFFAHFLDSTECDFVENLWFLPYFWVKSHWNSIPKWTMEATSNAFVMIDNEDFDHFCVVTFESGSV